MSFWEIAIVAATNAVIAPVHAITSFAHPACAMIGLRRVIR